MRSEEGSDTRTKPTSVVDRKVEVLQDLQWEESVAAAKMTAQHADIERYREAIVESAFVQSSYRTRYRYASYFIKWFLPSVSFKEPVAIVWKAFRQESSLEDVMRWRYVASNPIVAKFVDGPLSVVEPGQPADDLVDTYIITEFGSLREKSRNRLRANLRKVGLLVEQNRKHYRVMPEVAPEAVALLLAWIFARQPQMVAWHTLVSDPWWKRLGVSNESSLRETLQKMVERGLLSRFGQVDTLDQITTRYSLAEFESGEVRAQWD